MSVYPLAPDGLPARPSQDYAREKLVLVGNYMQIFTAGMRYHFPERIYLDLMAGPGMCALKNGSTFNGSPLISLERDFTARVMVEADTALAAALRKRCPAPTIVVEGDCNDAEVIGMLRSHVPRSALGLAFVDNLGLDVPLSTLSDLSHDRRIDLMIVFQVQDLTRNIRDVLAGSDSRSRYDAFFGGPAWETAARDCQAMNLSDADTASALLDVYRSALNGIGYPHVAEANRPMTNSRNAPQYRLVLAGKHERAVDFFAKIQRIDPRGQRSMF